jgi:hypothetical protein
MLKIAKKVKKRHRKTVKPVLFFKVCLHWRDFAGDFALSLHI